MTKNRVLALTIVILALLLSACGGGDAPAQEPPTEAPPTAVPASPTETPVPPATDTPVVEPTPEPPTPAPEAAAASGPCYTPYFPVLPDTTWRYRVESSAAEPTEFTIYYEDISGDVFTVVQTFPDFTTKVRWQCSERGMISTEYANFTFEGMMEGFSFETVDFEGISLPPAGQWQVGNTWDNSYTIKVSGDVEGQTFDTQMAVQTQSQIEAVEEVTVPAGTYPEAYKVKSTGSMTLQMGGAGATDIGVSYSTWYVEDVGMVKQVSNDDPGTSTVELVSME